MQSKLLIVGILQYNACIRFCKATIQIFVQHLVRVLLGDKPYSIYRDVGNVADDTFTNCHKQTSISSGFRPGNAGFQQSIALRKDFSIGLLLIRCAATQ